ncbi:MAG: alpha/beta hydrolase fold protein [Acidobacteriaceae bacterium]|nr:alpha/beta hydrolase fold protein [Acidobacteriaceae bacterium]
MKLFWRSLAAVVLLLIVAGLGFYRFPLWANDQVLRFGLWRQGVRSDYVTVGGERLHYFEAGPASGTPLLLVHGLGARGEDWGRLLPGLAARGFHVYAPDLLGYGRSAAPDVSYSISLEEQVIVGFMYAMHLTRPDVGGWSMGGWIAMKLALDHPEMVDRLVVYDSAGVYFEAASASEVFTPIDVAGVRKLVGVLSPRPMNLPDFVARDVVRRNGAIAWVIHRSVAAMMGGRDLMDFRLQGITRPTLVMWGSRDDLIPLATGETIHQRIAGSSMAVVEGCGHLAPSECWQPVLEGTVDFLRAEPAPRGARRVFPAQP